MRVLDYISRDTERKLHEKRIRPVHAGCRCSFPVDVVLEPHNGLKTPATNVNGNSSVALNQHS